MTSSARSPRSRPECCPAGPARARVRHLHGRAGQRARSARRRRLINGALTTCGIVAGAINLNEYQLDGEYALAQLLLPGQQVKLVRFTSVNDALATAATLQAAAARAQPTAAGRARLALALAFINTPPWDGSQAAPPPPSDPAAQEAAQYQVEFTGAFSTLDFIEAGRPSIDQADGGSANWTRGTNFAAVLARSPYLGEVAALYRAAGLSLRADLGTLTRNADITADPGAVASLERTSVPAGRLAVPELDLHTVSDQLVPVQQENFYAERVATACSPGLAPPGLRGQRGALQLQPRRARRGRPGARPPGQHRPLGLAGGSGQPRPRCRGARPGPGPVRFLPSAALTGAVRFPGHGGSRAGDCAAGTNRNDNLSTC